MKIASDPATAQFQKQLLRQDFITLVNEKSIHGGATTINEALRLACECLSTAQLVEWFDFLGVHWHVTELEDDQS